MFLYKANSQGQVVMPVRAAGARTKGDVKWLAVPATAGDEVMTDVDVSSSTDAFRACVWLDNCDSGDIGLVCVQGPVQATVTSGTFTAFHGIETDGGNIEDSGGTAVITGLEANTDFAIALESGTTVTTLKIYLIGAPYASTT